MVIAGDDDIGVADQGGLDELVVVGIGGDPACPSRERHQRGTATQSRKDFLGLFGGVVELLDQLVA